MKIIKDSKLEKIEIHVTESGFTLWINEKVDGVKTRHWLLDGSLCKEDGIIRLPNDDKYKYSAVYDQDDDSIKLINKNK